MFNLYQIVTGAQGGQALDNLARQFGVTREEADKTVQALMPALSTAFMAQAAHPGGLRQLASSLTDEQHKQAYADPNVAQAPETQQKSGDIVSNIFGNNAIVQQVVKQAAQYTGVPEATIQQMLPVIVSLVIGGVATAMHNQNLGGVLGQIANGLGGLFGQAGGTPGQTGGGGFGGLLGNIFGNLGGVHPGASPQAGPGGAGAPGASLPPAVQAGMEMLEKMFQPGVKWPTGMGGDLGAQISSMMTGKKS